MNIGFIVTTFFFSVAAFACDPVPLAPCNGITEKLFKLNQESLIKLSEKVRQFDVLLDQHIAKASRTKPPAISSCFNQHFFSMRIVEIKAAAREKLGKTCDAHVNLFSTQFKPEELEEMKYAFGGSVPIEIKKLISEVEAARLAFVRSHKR